MKTNQIKPTIHCTDGRCRPAVRKETVQLQFDGPRPSGGPPQTVQVPDMHPKFEGEIIGFERLPKPPIQKLPWVMLAITLFSMWFVVVKLVEKIHRQESDIKWLMETVEESLRAIDKLEPEPPLPQKQPSGLFRAGDTTI